MDESKIKLPSIARMIAEPFGLTELVNVIPAWGILESLPNGNGEPVMVIPGLTTNDISTTIVRKFLKFKGFNVYGWELGVNIKYSDSLEEKLIKRIDDIYQKHQQKVSIIGWSLGGITMRLLAKHEPKNIKQLIALGAPVAKITGATNVTWWYQLLTQEKTEDFNQQWAKDISAKPTMPSTSIYSKTDGMVSWEYCMDWETGPQTQNIEVLCNHLGFGMTPTVWYILVDRLRQPEDNWQHFDITRLEKIEKTTIFHA